MQIAILGGKQLASQRSECVSRDTNWNNCRVYRRPTIAPFVAKNMKRVKSVKTQLFNSPLRLPCKKNLCSIATFDDERGRVRLKYATSSALKGQLKSIAGHECALAALVREAQTPATPVRTQSGKTRNSECSWPPLTGECKIRQHQQEHAVTQSQPGPPQKSEEKTLLCCVHNELLKHRVWRVSPMDSGISATDNDWRASACMRYFWSPTGTSLIHCRT